MGKKFSYGDLGGEGTVFDEGVDFPGISKLYSSCINAAVGCKISKRGKMICYFISKYNSRGAGYICGEEIDTKLGELPMEKIEEVTFQNKEEFEKKQHDGSLKIVPATNFNIPFGKEKMQEIIYDMASKKVEQEKSRGNTIVTMHDRGLDRLKIRLGIIKKILDALPEYMPKNIDFYCGLTPNSRADIRALPKLIFVDESNRNLPLSSRNIDTEGPSKNLIRTNYEYFNYLVDVIYGDREADPNLNKAFSECVYGLTPNGQEFKDLPDLLRCANIYQIIELSKSNPELAKKEYDRLKERGFCIKNISEYYPEMAGIVGEMAKGKTTTDREIIENELLDIQESYVKSEKEVADLSAQESEIISQMRALYGKLSPEGQKTFITMIKGDEQSQK